MAARSNRPKIVTWRCSDYLLAMVDDFCMHGYASSRQQALIYAVTAFLSRPTVYSKLDIKALREPMKNLVSMELTQSTYDKMSGFCLDNGLSISEVVRMAVYQEVIQYYAEERRSPIS